MSQQRNYDEYDHRPHRPKKRRRSVVRIIGGAMLYAVVVIVVSMILACLAWIAANDVLALNKEDRVVTVNIASGDTFDDVTAMLKKNGLIEYECPHCGTVVFFDEEAFDMEEDHLCPNCNRKVFDEEDEEDDEE